jgi:hypothetical protein
MQGVGTVAMMVGVRGAQMSPQELAEAYLDALGRAGPATMLSLFSNGALVHSPLHGPVPPQVCGYDLHAGMRGHPRWVRPGGMLDTGALEARPGRRGDAVA